MGQVTTPIWQGIVYPNWLQILGLLTDFTEACRYMCKWFTGYRNKFGNSFVTFSYNTLATL